jgi:putative transposase
MPLYHVWFGTRSRKWLLQGEIPDAAKQEFDAIAERQNIKLLEREAIVDHVHMLLDSPDKDSLSRAMNFLKGASARALFLRYPSIKMDAETNSFWQRGYGSKVIPPQREQQIREYIRTMGSPRRLHDLTGRSPALQGGGSLNL